MRRRISSITIFYGGHEKDLFPSQPRRIARPEIGPKKTATAWPGGFFLDKENTVDRPT
jgi:hypothetical protein